MPASKGKYGGRKVREGTVVSDKMQKTILVAVEEHVKHRLYKKRVKRVHKFMAHDEAETAKLGDRVRIIESRPVSRNKRWAIVEVLQRVELPEVAAESIDLDLLGEVKPVVEEPVAAVPAEEPAVEEAPVAEPEAVEAEAEAEAEVAAPEEVVVEEAVDVQAEPVPVAEEPEPAAAAEPEAVAVVAEEPATEPAAEEAPAVEEAPAEAAEEAAADVESEPAAEEEKA
jgi:small subunit ribosomal protein S17